MRTAEFQRRWHPSTMHLIPRAERAAVRVSKLGPRVTLELLLEIGARHDCIADVVERLESYSRMSPEVIRAVGADRMPPRHPVLVSSR